PHSVGLNSCTAALHLALLALDIGPGDEVITTPMTFIATATAILHTGAKPVFVDVEQDTGLMDPEAVVAAITPATKAILPVHLYGSMCDMRRLRTIADAYGLFIIEDCAHCIEGMRDGVQPGALSNAACFSFYATKNMTCGEGGALSTMDEALAARVLLLRQHGMSKEAADRYHGAYRHWDMLDCGWKYNMDNIHASILLPQLRKIDALWEKRRDLYERYVAALSVVPGIRFPKIPAGSKSAFHLFTVLIERAERDHVLESLSRQGIGVAVNYRAIHLLEYLRKRFGHKAGDFPHAEEIGRKTISLPFWVGMGEREVDIVVSALHNDLVVSTR
ncbi:MAG: DegT/DnrJ/EryC1/StrS aminotransferase family protein, partial [Desulfobulbaceae bacterium]|nr:DegT/DnrJ/EryC1/StrS aminotransferase family protein [Desulfobulbaceae bacterium]